MTTVIDVAHLRELIRDRFGTQAAFAEKLGVSKQYIWQILNGKREPTVERLLQFSELLGVSTDELLGKEPALVA